MTLTDIRNAVITRMTTQTALDKDAVTWPNDKPFNPSGRALWARLTNIPGLAGANEIGNGLVVHRTGIVIIQLFVPTGTGSLRITETADKLRELFEFQTDGRLDYFAVSAIEAGETDGWAQMNLSIPYRAL